ncbi:MAG: hypothetical protein CVU40_14340 [Chloroflexi bacterium HGW-Chloroflexi-2]|nr:MAG: hypothetical protein CVU40_14340 [Chloroflexi bacterium HGW-Chloroflexi-2]
MYDGGPRTGDRESRDLRPVCSCQNTGERTRESSNLQVSPLPWIQIHGYKNTNLFKQVKKSFLKDLRFSILWIPILWIDS